VKKYSSLLLILLISCSGSNQVDEESVAEEFISTTTQFNGITTTTIKIEETTTTTPTEYIGEQIISDLKLEILNCPSDKVDIEIGEDFEIKFSVQAGDFDVTSIFYYFELNGEYYSRLPLDRENHSEYFDFPTANDITYSATYVEKLAEGDSYLVSIDVSDEDLFFSYDLCKVDF
jgi:hypothetical protein